MSLLSKKPRRLVLVVGLMISVGIGSALGRAYEASLGLAPEAAAEAAPGDDSEELMAEAFDLERPAPPPRPPEASPERRAALARNMVQLERTGQVALRARMPLPQKAGELISIGDQLDAHGVPMNLAAFETRMSVVDVLDFYARHFEAQGWPYSTVPSAQAAVPYPRLSATLLEEELQLTVMVMPHGEGEGSTVVLGQSDMEAFRKGLAREDTGDLPVYPGTHPVAVRARDEGRATLTVSFDTRDAPAAVEDFYRKALAQRGYTEVADPRQQEKDTATPRTLHFASRGGAWNLALSTRDQGTAVTAHSTRHLEAAP